MTTREQNIEAMALANHRPNHAPVGDGDWACDHVDAIDCIRDKRYRYLDDAAIAYDALLETLPIPLRSILEGDEPKRVQFRPGPFLASIAADWKAREVTKQLIHHLQEQGAAIDVATDQEQTNETD